MSIRQFCVRTSLADLSSPKEFAQCAKRFKPFIPKRGMKLAPTVRSRPLTKQQMEDFDSIIAPSEKDSERLYLAELRAGHRKPRSWKRTELAEPDVIMVPVQGQANSNAACSTRRKKLLQFHENRRPSKYGYWVKTSKIINGRRPLAKDENVFDYDVDSDDEWEEEEGDDCKSDEEDEENDNDKEADDEDKGFFVDHGYLSTSENGSDEEDADPESRRERGKAKMLTFEAEMESRKKKHLRLVSIGPVWTMSSQDLSASQKLAEFNALILTTKEPVQTSFTPSVQKTPVCGNDVTPRSEQKSLKRKAQDQARRQSKRGALSLP